ncbi:MAG: SUMF1/EgtB/PvdO family nonheme iron enzyme [Spirochaetes bacterium]|nr:SUMF1/EgtB/PvdO family nonheme iron enzyme [Spirochaetota bacterium]
MRRNTLALVFSIILAASLPAEKFMLIPVDPSLKPPAPNSLAAVKGNWQETMLATRARILDALAAGRSSCVEVVLGDWYSTESLGVKSFTNTQFPEPEREGINLEAVYDNNDPKWTCRSSWINRPYNGHKVNTKQVAYFYRTIAVDKPCTLDVYIGKAFAIALWINEQKVIEEISANGELMELKTNITLEAKTNTVLLKVYNTTNKNDLSIGMNITTGANAYNTEAVWQTIKGKYPRLCDYFERDLPNGRHLLWLTSTATSLERGVLASVMTNLGDYDPQLAILVEKALRNDSASAKELFSLYEQTCYAREYLDLAAAVDTTPLRAVLTDVASVTGSVSDEYTAALNVIDASLIALKNRYRAGDYALVSSRAAKPMELFAADIAAQKNAPVRARFIRIEQQNTLSLAEVEVQSEGKNIAPQGKASQSTTASGADAARAIDGRTDGAWSSGSVTHTTEKIPGWWELDLGAEKNIESIRVWNRTDCCGDRLVGANIQALGEDRSAAWSQKIETFSSGGGGDKDALINAYTDIRKKIMFLNPLLDFDKLLCIRQQGDPRLPANWQGNCSIGGAMGGGRSSEIAILSPVRPDGSVTTLYKPASNRVLADIDLHFDADRMLFSMPDDVNAAWQVYEMDLASKSVRVLSKSDYPDIHNTEACYLPSGKIVFASTRVYAGVPCVAGADPVANLFIMNDDGSGVRRLCFDQEQDWNPTVLNNGKIMYTRWEYTDTAHYFTRIVMHMNPDGTSQTELYGSGSFWPNSLFYSRPIPNHPTMLIGIVSGHHGVSRMGELILYDPAKGRFEADGVIQRVGAKEKKVIPIIDDQIVNNSWPKYLHPYPLSDKYFIVSSKPSPSESWGIYLVDVHGNRQLIKEEKGYSLLEPIPLRKTKKPPVIQDKIKTNETNALVYLQDVYTGGGLRGVPRGEVSKLRLFTYVYTYNKIGGHQDVAYEGGWEVKAILGTVPVYEDGSAFFSVPANTPIAVQPLDREGKALQLMRSWFTAMPGETLSCVGCHESQNAATIPKRTTASLKKPVTIDPWYGQARGFSFEREVQPVLDAYCVGCHNGTKTNIPNFTFRKGNFINNFPESYNELHPYVWRPGPESDYHLPEPLEYHADVSELVQKLKKGHHGVTLDAEGWERIITWIDLNVPCIGSWMEYRASVSNFYEKRQAMLAQYTSCSVDYEKIINPYAMRNFISPSPPPEMLPAPAVQRWPLSRNEAAELQKNAGQNRTKTVDLGNGVTMTLVLIPQGTYRMGGESGERNKEVQRQVTVSNAFWMAETEVTLAQYHAFDPSHENGYIDQQSKDHTTRGYDANDPRHPVIRVSYEEATKFCEWLSQKAGVPVMLPSEEEWEWACRAGTDTPFFFGDVNMDFSPYANLADKSVSLLAVQGVNPKPIRNPNKYVDFIPKDARFNDANKILSLTGIYKPNPWGLKDMHGNVAEWTRSDFTGFIDVGGNSVFKTVRGGSWRDRPYRATSFFRMGYRPYQRVFNVGFRVAAALH